MDKLTNKNMQEKGTGLRYNEGKLRYDLIHPDAVKGLVEVLSFGAAKYGDSNWTKGMKWSNVVASLKRHLAAIEGGEDIDSESLLYHIDHLQCNAHFLSAYYRIYPQGDDRQNTFFDKRVALDIDGVCFDFEKSFCEYVGLESRNNHWHFSYEWAKHREELKTNKDFWVNMEPLIDGRQMPFEPIAFVTNRQCPIEWTMEALEKNGFPCEKVYHAENSKVEVLKNIGVDLFVDDCYSNFVDLNKNGVFCYLYDREYNRKYSIGHKRIYSLDEIVKR